MAIRVLLDHGVDPSRIIFVTFLMAHGCGVAHLRRAFPAVHIVTGAVDSGLREVWLPSAEDADGADPEGGQAAWVIEPGMGQIGAYFLCACGMGGLS
jgi:uridine kinase